MKKFTILVITLFIFFNCNGKRKGFLPILGFGTVSENSSNSSILTNSQFVTYTTNVTGGYIKEISISSSKEKEEETKITIANAIPTAKVEIDTRTREDFNYQTIRNIPVDMIVYDSNGSFMPNTLITITDGSPTNSEINIIFQQVTNSEGHVSGSIDVNTSVTQVEASVCIGDSSSIPVPIPLRVNTCKEKENNCKTTKGITKIGDIIVPVDFNRVETKITDEDGDGVDDIMDFYPDNPNKAFKIRFPSTGVNTISYEDLFPSAGDADLNDYTIQTYMEEDLNGKGEVVEIRGYYQHVAKGADYDHTLNLRLPDSVEIESFESVILDYKGNNTKTGKLIKFPSKDIIQDGLEILGNGNKTISSKNSSKKDKYKPGHIARVKIAFSRPVSKKVLGSAPLDLFIKILSKKVNKSYPADAPRSLTAENSYYEVHFPGKYFYSSGKDVYIDKQGFPWTIMVPGVWAWPFESQDIRKSGAYPKFNNWVNSKGTEDVDWYKEVEPSKVFPVDPEPSRILLESGSSLLAYLSATTLKTRLLYLLLGIIFITGSSLIYRNKFIKTA